MPLQPDIPRHPIYPGDTMTTASNQNCSLPWIWLRDLEWAAAATACYHQSHHVCTGMRERHRDYSAAFCPLARDAVYSYFIYDFYSSRHPKAPRAFRLHYRKLLHEPIVGNFQIPSVTDLFAIIRCWHKEDMNRLSDMLVNQSRREYLFKHLTGDNATTQRYRDYQSTLPMIRSDDLRCTTISPHSMAVFSDNCRIAFVIRGASTFTEVRLLNGRSISFLCYSWMEAFEFLRNWIHILPPNPRKNENKVSTGNKTSEQ